MNWILTCEHGGNKIPKEYSPLFKGANEVLQSHRGWDIGVPEIYEAFLKLKPDYSAFADVSRLLVELNRNIGRKNHFSEFTEGLPETEKSKLIQSYFSPFRESVKDYIKSQVDERQLLHLSVHTFTPVFNSKERNADISLLYDPKNLQEKEFCRQWKRDLALFLPTYNVRFNYPYKGIADGHTTWLRKRIKNYAGIELEVNQKYFEKTHPERFKLIKGLTNSFLNVLD
ncbi:MAG: putative N-formylglutamate amidohydrolase [Sphingobacteriales bacterium]|jgi:predicted N-formylglutamate amidohydrolase